MTAIVILEDDARRTAEMLRVLPAGCAAWIERTEQAMIARLDALHGGIAMVSLDHDLEKLARDDPDPGDGRGVARWLAAQGWRIPVLLHTSNSLMGDTMFFTLTDAGYAVERIDPYDDLAWIARSWLPLVIRLAGPSAISGG